tara:strand:- start:413 stop:655 length:243 start_codon:yes stop_codon:yes gene_type:complete
MVENAQIEGKLLALHWNASETEATLDVDVSKPQLITAEIEDANGITHRVEVSVYWDADFLVGKEVTTQLTDNGVVLEQVE